MSADTNNTVPLVEDSFPDDERLIASMIRVAIQETYASNGVTDTESSVDDDLTTARTNLNDAGTEGRTTRSGRRQFARVRMWLI